LWFDKRKGRLTKEREKEKEIMTVKQVAEYLQMDEHTLYKLACSGQSLPSRLQDSGDLRKMS